MQCHIRMMEYQMRVLGPEASRRKGEAVTQMCNVIDVAELSVGMLTREVVGVLKTVAKIDEACAAPPHPPRPPRGEAPDGPPLPSLCARPS